MKILKICLAFLCLLPVQAVGLPQICGAIFFMKKISLTRGYVAIVDDDDYETLINFKWQVQVCKHTCYAVRASKRDPLTYKQKRFSMHRDIMGLDNIESNVRLLIDHKNRNGLDNRKINLRIATYSQNQLNKNKKTGTSSKYIGVCWHIRDELWSVTIRVNRNPIFIGTFQDEHIAAKAYDEAAKKYHGEFANLNFKS